MSYYTYILKSDPANTGLLYAWGLQINSNFNAANTLQVENPDSPLKFTLEQNYPNPFNPATKIKFSIAKISNIKLIVYDILGREVTKIIDEKLNAGSYAVDFIGENLSSGVYFYKLITDSYIDIKKMILVK